MDIWVKTPQGQLYNLSRIDAISTACEKIIIVVSGNVCQLTKYASEERAQEVIQLIQDHINSIGTNNFNNLEMVYVMPKE